MASYDIIPDYAAHGPKIDGSVTKCIERCLKDLGPLGWTSAPIYHDLPDQTIWVPRPRP